MEEGGDRVDSWHHRTPSQAVIEAVADAEGVAPTDLCPPTYESLHDVVDPSALDDLFAPRHNGIPRGNGRITFQFCGYTVMVTGDGNVTLE
ncbi:HalOD1 output domain-containing protein [Natronobiforma cellulositropha]|uniref:HalOD1 output domain-containing protein n=1 Tax=Natronobiforma cellulositropha TaxID=1679076 RepID=UPI0021D5B6BE|nr:HalOD1 output domain-containing protein [Natronobiforma cellulositropha]